MTRRARQASESGWYHVTMRGAGRRALFEDDDDRTRFLRGLDDAARRSDEMVEAPAWCLMDNHVHLVTKAADLSSLQKAIHWLCSGHASRFNRKNGHVGPVFQERFASFPIESDAYLMEAVRYIHLNCRDKGFEDPARYRWSSYPLFMDGPRTLTWMGSSTCSADRRASRGSMPRMSIWAWSRRRRTGAGSMMNARAASRASNAAKASPKRSP